MEILRLLGWKEIMENGEEVLKVPE